MVRCWSSCLAAGFAGVSRGYSANVLLGTIDLLLAGITEAASHMIDPDYVVGPEINWYFMLVSTVLMTILGAFVTERIVEPRLGEYDPSQASIDLGAQSIDQLSVQEKRGLKVLLLLYLGPC